MKALYLDTETTGFKPGQITQLAIIEDDGVNIKGYNYFFTVKHMEPGAIEACGRDENWYAKYSNGLEFKDLAAEIIRLFENSGVVAHNLKFDENFLSAEFWRADIVFKPTYRVDTMEMFTPIMKLPNVKKKYAGEYKYPKLCELTEWLNIDDNKILEFSQQIFGNEDGTNSGFHDARFDTTAMYVACKVYGDRVNNTNTWINRFCKL